MDIQSCLFKDIDNVVQCLLWNWWILKKETTDKRQIFKCTFVNTLLTLILTRSLLSIHWSRQITSNRGGKESVLVRVVGGSPIPRLQSGLIVKIKEIKEIWNMECYNNESMEMRQTWMLKAVNRNPIITQTISAVAEKVSLNTHTHLMCCNAKR